MEREREREWDKEGGRKRLHKLYIYPDRSSLPFKSTNKNSHQIAALNYSKQIPGRHPSTILLSITLCFQTRTRRRAEETRGSHFKLLRCSLQALVCHTVRSVVVEERRKAEVSMTVEWNTTTEALLRVYGVNSIFGLSSLSHPEHLGDATPQCQQLYGNARGPDLNSPMGLACITMDQIRVAQTQFWGPPWVHVQFFDVALHS